MQQVISTEEITLHPGSYIDPNARLFTWNNELYRGFVPSHATFYKNLFHNGVVDKLISEGFLVPSYRTNFRLESMDLVVRHESMKFVSYCYEWPSSMLKDAALYTLDCNLKLLSYDLIMQDAHPWNFTFHHMRPLFLDFGSIVPVTSMTVWKAYDQFLQFFLYPLYLCANGLSDIARHLLSDSIHGVSIDHVQRLTKLSFKLNHPQYFKRVFLPQTFDKLLKKHFHKLRLRLDSLTQKATKFIDTKTIITNILRSLRKDVANIKLSDSRSHWVSYYEDKYDNLTHDHGAKEKSLSTILGNITYHTLLDLGCNTGKFSLMASNNSCHVSACDADEASVSSLYQRTKHLKLDVLPLVMNVLNPTPPMGLMSSQFLSAEARFKSDVVLALAIIHHLILTQRQTFDTVARVLNSLSNKYLILEFVSLEDFYADMIVKHNPIASSIVQDYRLENCIRALKHYFSHMEIYPSENEKRSILFFSK